MADLGAGAKGPWPPPPAGKAPTSEAIKDYLLPVWEQLKYLLRARATREKPHFLCFGSPPQKILDPPLKQPHGTGYQLKECTLRKY